MKMTGRELIMFIMQNKLENTTLFELMSETEAATKFDVGIATIRVWYNYGYITGGFDIGGTLYLLKDTPDPRKGV
jgi:hypothetical protein